MAAAKQHTAVHSLAGRAENSGTGVCWDSEHTGACHLCTAATGE